jgi:putative tricarboxylic transport membrane protein
MGVFWSNGLVGSITTLGLVLLFWPLLAAGWGRLMSAPAKA